MAKILLAEDSATHTALMRSLLEQDGHCVDCVVDGQLAWEAVQASRPDLLVTDLRRQNRTVTSGEGALRLVMRLAL